MLGYGFKRAIAFVVIKSPALAFVGFWRAVGFVVSIKGSVLIFFRGPLHIVRDKQVELAVIVVIKPDCAGGKSSIAHASFRRDIGEPSIAQIAEQTITSHACDVDIFVAVIVVIGDRATESV